MSMAPMEVLAVSDGTISMCRPCVDCGLVTGRFCDWCLGKDRISTEEWNAGQHTPLCSYCDNHHNACHYCRRVHWATPFPHDGAEALKATKKELKALQKALKAAAKSSAAKPVDSSSAAKQAPAEPPLASTSKGGGSGKGDELYWRPSTGQNPSREVLEALVGPGHWLLHSPLCPRDDELDGN